MLPKTAVVHGSASQLLVVCWAVLTSVLITTAWQFSLFQFVVAFSSVLLIVVCWVIYISWWRHRFVLLALLLGLLVGGIRGILFHLTLPPGGTFAQTTTLTGTVVSEFTTKSFSGSFTLQPKQGSNVLVQVSSDRTVVYGDYVQVTGKLEPPPELESFNYPRYLASRGIVAQLKAKTLLVLTPHSQRWTLAPLFSFKQWLIQRLEHEVPTPASGLVVGMLLGDKTGIPAEWLNTFKVTGLSHIVAVSGYNVSVVIGVLASAYRYVGRRRLLVPLLIVIVAFALMTGGGSSVWRAALMAVVLLVGQYCGRYYDARTALWFSAAVLALINPLVVIADVGFQLSVLATAGIIYGVPLCQYFLPDRYRDNSLLLGIVVSLCAIIATLPIIMYQFGQVSLVALPVNIVVVPLVPLIMLLGVLSMLPVIGAGTGLLTGATINYLMGLLTWVAQLPFAQQQYSLTLLELIAALITLVILAWLGNRCWQLSRRVNL